MAKILPFKGIRYSQELKNDLDKVVSPPYDIITPEQQKELYERDPHNFVRLVLGEERPSDNENENRFTRAGEYLREWLQSGILIRDKKPAFYVYQQEYKMRGRTKSLTGFICLVKIYEYEERVILPHEQTLAKPKSGLLELLRQTRANLDSVYSLFEDTNGSVGKMATNVVTEPPLMEARDYNGELHRVWRVDDESQILEVQASLRDANIFIADGHHRYETSLAYRNEMRAKTNTDAELPSDYVMMTLVDANCPDLTIFPTHRMIYNVSEEKVKKLTENLSARFEIIQSSADRLITDMEKGGEQALGAYFGGKALVLLPKTGVEPPKIEGEPAAVRNLPVTRLHRLIFEECLGINEQNLRDESNVVYTRDEALALELVDKGEYQAAFLLNPTPVRHVSEVAKSGGKMPQKATYFYPKLLSGLVIRLMDE